MGAVPYDYKRLPAQLAMFNAFNGLTDMVQHIAAFPMPGEGGADYLVAKSLQAGTVPSWVTEPYQKIHEDEEEQGNYPFGIRVNYPMIPEKQERGNLTLAKKHPKLVRRFATRQFSILSTRPTTSPTSVPPRVL